MKKLTVLMLLLSIFCYFRITSANADVIGVWLFDEGNGKIVKDVSGNEHHGEIVGEVAWANGKSMALKNLCKHNVPISRFKSRFRIVVDTPRRRNAS